MTNPFECSKCGQHAHRLARHPNGGLACPNCQPNEEEEDET